MYKMEFINAILTKMVAQGSNMGTKIPLEGKSKRGAWVIGP